MMPKAIIFLCILFNSKYIFADESREHKILNLIDVELKQITSVKSMGPKLEFRVFQLKSEQVQIIRRIENKNFLKEGSSANKKYFFSKSNQLYLQAQKKGRDFIKKYPNSPYKSEVFFTLASNTIEVKNNIEKDQTEILNNLEVALNYAKDKKLVFNIKLKLAEIFYTLKNYEKSVFYYQQVVVNKEDQWLPKNLYNYAWSEFQLKNYKKAIELAHQAYEYSKQQKYVDMKDQLDEAFSYFYVFDQRPSEAIELHAKNHEKPREHLLKVVTLSNKYISSETAMQAESQSRKICKNRQDNICLYLLSGFKLDIYKAAKAYEDHFKATTISYQEFIKLMPDEKKELEDHTLQIVENLTEVSQFFIKMVYKDYYPVSQNQELSYQYTIDYLKYLKKFNPDKTYEYAYLQAEVSYKEKKYKPAAGYYFASHSSTPDKIQAEFYPKLFKSMLDLANNENFKSLAFYEKTYLSILKFGPQDSKNSQHYQDLFSFYLLNKKEHQAEKTLNLYVQNIPEKSNKQKEMTKTLLNSYIDHKNSKKLISWISRIRGGFLNFDMEFLNQNILILAGLLFDKIEEEVQQNRYSEAIDQYKQIYHDRQYPIEIQSESAFRISILYLKKQNVPDSYEWLKVAIKEFNPKDKKLKLEQMKDMAVEYADLQQTVYSIKLATHLINNHCNDLKKESRLAEYYRLSHLLLAHSQAQKSLELLDQAESCQIDQQLVSQIKKNIIDWSFSHRKYNFALSIKEDSYLYDKFYTAFWSFPHDLKLNHDFETLKSYFTKFLAQSEIVKPEQSSFLQQYESFKSLHDEVLEIKFSLKNKITDELDNFANEMEEQTNSLNAINDRLALLAKETNFPEIYVSTLSLQFLAYQKYYRFVDSFNYEDLSPEANQELSQYLAQIKQHIESEQQKLVKSHQKTTSQQNVLTSYSKYFHYEKNDLYQHSTHSDRKIGLISSQGGRE